MNSFLSALSFYTRIPVPARVHHSTESLDKGTKYLPLIGTLVGAFGAAVFMLSSLLFSRETSLIFSIAATVLLTGAFHEDGFSDTCDGLGGGWTAAEKLRIMKDSRVGAYGLIGTVLLLLLKLSLLKNQPAGYTWQGIVIAHTVSRLVPVWLIKVLEYVRLDETSKVKPVAKKMGTGGLIFATLTAVGITAALHYQLLPVLVAVPLLITGFSIAFKKQLGGYTGDLLGASQQISEITVLAGMTVLWKFFL